MDKSNLELCDRVSKLVNDLKMDKQTRSKMMLDTEKKYDTKISVFTEAINKETKKQIDLCMKKVNTSLTEMRVIIGQFKIGIQAQINDFIKTPLSTIKKLQDEIKCIKNDVEKIDFKGLSNAYAIERQARDEDTNSQNKKIIELEKNLQRYHDKIV